MKTILLSVFACLCLYLPLFAQDENIDRWENKHCRYYLDKDYKKALKCFQEEIAINPDSCDPYSWVGLILGRMYTSSKDSCELNKAIENMEIATRLCPDNVIYKTHKVTLKWKTKIYRTNIAAIYQDCMQELMSIAQEDNKPHDYYTLRGSILMEYTKENGTLPTYEDEIAYLLRKGFFIERNRMTAYNLACMYSLLSKKDKALLWLEEALMEQDIVESKIDEDKDFDPIRQDQRFSKLMQERFHSKNIDNITEQQPAQDISGPDAAYILVSAPDPFVEVEQKPRFSGGEKAMLEYIENNIRIPEDGLKYGINQKIFIRFVVKNDGSISDAKILSSSLGALGALNRLYTDEALRLVRSFPKWIPGKRDGHFVSAYYTIPITFESEGSVEF